MKVLPWSMTFLPFCIFLSPLGLQTAGVSPLADNVRSMLSMAPHVGQVQPMPQTRLLNTRLN